MRVTVRHDIDDLASDLTQIAVATPRAIDGAVRDEARLGNELARGFAVKSAGAHGKHYPKAFSVERTGLWQWEYGPDAAKPQGGMSFEGGSRNQKPHQDLARSADIIGPAFPQAVANEVADLFWPGA